MDIYDENTYQLVAIWEDKKERQNAKLVIMKAIAEATTLSAKEAAAILAELDHLLLKEKEEGQTKKDMAL